ncbi:hypothetical protein [Gryllotalpicola koreensis]
MIDSECAADYDPWAHADDLGAPLVYRADLPLAQMVACYSNRHRAIFVRSGLTNAVERCAVAHELVHYEHRDIGTTTSQERRADRIAAQRLIRPSKLSEVMSITEDIGRAALDLEVTERVMRTYLRFHTHWTL